MAMARWFTAYEADGFPIECAALAGCGLAVAFVAGEWQWLMRRDGCDVAKSSARACLAAKQQAEGAALRFLDAVARAA